MKLGLRTRKRGQVDKVLAKKRALAARMHAGPPLPPRFASGGDVALAIARRGTVALVTHASEKPPNNGVLFAASDGPELGGSLELLEDLRRDLETTHGAERPRLVAVDFVIDEIQIDRICGSGADAVVLVARLVSDADLSKLVDRARQLGLEPIVEVHTPDELERALGCGVLVVAASARDRDHGRLAVEEALAIAARIDGRARSVALSVPLDCVEKFSVFDWIVTSG